MNTVILIGAIVEQQLKYTPSGLAILETTLAGDAERGAWYQRVTTFGDLAERASEYETGTVVLASGELQQDTWQGKDGEKRSAIKVKANELYPSLEDYKLVEDKRGQGILQNSVHTVWLSGKLTRDAETREAGSTQVANAALARNTKRGGEDKAQYFDVAAWRDQAAFDALRAGRKGDRMTVRGTLSTRSWEGQDGRKRYKTEVMASHAWVERKDVQGARLDIDEEFPSAEGLPF